MLFFSLHKNNNRMIIFNAIIPSEGHIPAECDWRYKTDYLS